MPKTIDTTGFEKNQNCSDSTSQGVPILDHESELLRLRIKEVVGDQSLRAFARDAGIGPTSLRDYIDGRRTPKRSALDRIAFQGRVSSEWLATGKGHREVRGVSYASHSNDNSHLLESPTAQRPSHDGQINANLLRLCLLSCKQVFGEDFSNALITIQMQYAVEFYNQLVQMANAKTPHTALNTFCQLDSGALSEQLRVFIKMGWARKFPSDSSDRPHPGPNVGTWS